MHDRATVLTGEPAAVNADLVREFEVLLAENSTLAFRVAYSVLRHREDAEDVAQDAFAKAYRSFSRLRNRDKFRAWLVRMTWRLALDRQRNDRRRVARDSSMIAVAEPASDPAGGERTAQLWCAIDRLPPKLRIVIVLNAIEGHDVAEVAQLLDIPPGTVKSRLFLARQQLREQLQWMT